MKPTCSLAASVCMAPCASWTPLVFMLPAFCALSEASSSGACCAALRALCRARFCAFVLRAAGPAISPNCHLIVALALSHVPTEACREKFTVQPDGERAAAAACERQGLRGERMQAACKSLRRLRVSHGACFPFLCPLSSCLQDARVCCWRGMQGCSKLSCQQRLRVSVV